MQSTLALGALIPGEAATVTSAGVVDTTTDFDAFYRAQYPRLTGSLRLVCGSTGAAEDIAQEAFLKALARWGRVSQLDNPAGWLYRVAFNLVRRRWKLGKRDELETPVSKGAALEFVANRVVLESALAQLPLPQRKAIVARHVLGLTGEEAAELLGMTPGALRVCLHRGVAALRDGGLLQDITGSVPVIRPSDDVTEVSDVRTQWGAPDAG